MENTINSYLNNYNAKVTELANALKPITAETSNQKDIVYNEATFDLTMKFQQELQGVIIGYNMAAENKLFVEKDKVFCSRKMSSRTINYSEDICTYKLV